MNECLPGHAAKVFCYFCKTGSNEPMGRRRRKKSRVTTIISFYVFVRAGVHVLALDYAIVCECAHETRPWTNPSPFEEWKAQRMERQSENFTGAEGKLPWTLRCMKVQFVSHLFCFPSIRRKGALRPPRRKCPCEGLWVHRGSCRFNLPDQSFPFLPCTVRALNVITTALCDFTFLFIFLDLRKPKNNAFAFGFFQGMGGLKWNNDASLSVWGNTRFGM